MCDKGLLETNPDVMKLEYCIAIYPELQEEMLSGISKLIGKPVYILQPIKGQYPNDRIYGDRNSIIITTDKKRDIYSSRVAEFSLKELPGCCGVLVSYHTNIAPSYRGKGINSFLQGIKEKIARDNFYTVLLCTTTKDNKAEIHILKKYGWQFTGAFNNRRTDHDVLFFMKILNTVK